MVPITMPAMAPPSRPELEVLPEATTTVVVGSWREMRRVRPKERVRVGAIVACFGGGPLCWRERLARLGQRTEIEKRSGGEVGGRILSILASW